VLDRPADPATIRAVRDKVGALTRDFAVYR
jgi:hypothetical protein